MAWIDACESVWTVRLQSILVVSDVKCLLFSEFADNTHMRLFEGPSSYIRPSYNSESRGSGIFKALGSMFCRMGTDSLFCQKCVTGTLPVGRRKRYSFPVLMMSDRRCDKLIHARRIC